MKGLIGVVEKGKARQGKARQWGCERREDDEINMTRHDTTQLNTTIRTCSWTCGNRANTTDTPGTPSRSRGRAAAAARLIWLLLLAMRVLTNPPTVHPKTCAIPGIRSKIVGTTCEGLAVLSYKLLTKTRAKSIGCDCCDCDCGGKDSSAISTASCKAVVNSMACEYPVANTCGSRVLPLLLLLLLLLLLWDTFGSLVVVVVEEAWNNGGRGRGRRCVIPVDVDDHVNDHDDAPRRRRRRDGKVLLVVNPVTGTMVTSPHHHPTGSSSISKAAIRHTPCTTMVRSFARSFVRSWGRSDSMHSNTIQSNRRIHNRRRQRMDVIERE